MFVLVVVYIVYCFSMDLSEYARQDFKFND